MSAWCCHCSGASFLISSNDALISRRWCLCSMEAPQAVVPPKWLWSGWVRNRLGCRLTWSRWCSQSWCARQCCLASPLCLSCDLAALKKRVESGGPEARFVPYWVEVVCRGSLPVKAESSADQTVVAASVIATIAIKPWTIAGGGAWLARWATGDARRASSAARHPGQDHVNQSSEDQAHSNGYTESYDQRTCEERNRMFYSLCCTVSKSIYPKLLNLSIQIDLIRETS